MIAGEPGTRGGECKGDECWGVVCVGGCSRDTTLAFTGATECLPPPPTCCLVPPFSGLWSSPCRVLGAASAVVMLLSMKGELQRDPPGGTWKLYVGGQTCQGTWV